MVRMRAYINALVIFLCLALPANAAAPLEDLDFKGQYSFALGGIPFGKLGMEFTQAPTHYSATSDITLTGVVRLFINHTSHTTSSGTGADFRYTNTVYESTYQTRKKPKHVKIERKNGRITYEIAEPPGDGKSRGPVAAADKNPALDPLTIGLGMRTELARALRDGRTHFSLNYYDGRRLTQVDLTLQGERTITIGGQDYETYVVDATRKAIAGYTAKEQASIGPNDPTLTLFFSKDKRLLPLRLQVPLLFGTASATLVRECGESESCLMGLRT